MDFFEGGPRYSRFILREHLQIRVADQIRGYDSLKRYHSPAIFQSGRILGTVAGKSVVLGGTTALSAIAIAIADFYFARQHGVLPRAVFYSVVPYLP